MRSVAGTFKEIGRQREKYQNNNPGEYGEGEPILKYLMHVCPSSAHGAIQQCNRAAAVLVLNGESIPYVLDEIVYSCIL